MKKIFFLIFALFVCTLAKAQTITDDFESYTAFTVDPAGTWTYYDGDGVQAWGLIDVTVPNLPYTGSCIILNPTQTSPVSTDDFGAHSGNQYLAIFSANPNYMTTTGTTNDWLISPELPFTNGGTLTFWARELTTSYGSEEMRILYSTTNNSPGSFILIQEESVSTTTWTQYNYAIPAGAKYVALNCVSDDVLALFIDDISLTFSTPDPFILAQPNFIDFGEILQPGSETTTLPVIGCNLTSDINVNIPSPFEVSTDNTNFSTSLTLPPSGGTLYVRYAPTGNSHNSGTMTLYSGTTVATVGLRGVSVDCNAPRSIPYTCDFTTGSMELNCWQIVDANHDATSSHNGELFFDSDIVVYHYHSSNDADDWLISPEIALGTNSSAYFLYIIESITYPEAFGVYVIPQGQTWATATAVVAPHTVYDTAVARQNIDLSAYDNQTVRIAIHVTSAYNMYNLYFGHFVVQGTPPVPPTLTSDVNFLDFGRVRVGSMREEVAVLTSTNLNEPIDIVTAAPFSVSTDGVNFSTNLTIPANPTTNVDDTLYIRFVPDSASSYIETVVATTVQSDLSVTITMKGSSFTCDTVTEFTFTEDFEDASTTRDCWDMNDANNDGSTFSFTGGGAQYSGNATNPADDWLISPEIALTGNQLLTFDYRTPDSQTRGKFTVLAQSIDTVLPLIDTIDVTNNTYTTKTVDLRSLNGIYRISFHCVSEAGAASLDIDNFTIQDFDEPFLSVNPDMMTFESVVDSATAAQTANVTGWGLTEAISVSTTAPFEISTDGNTYGTTATIAISTTDLETNATFYVRYSPTSEGEHSGMVILTSGNAADTILLNGSVPVPIVNEGRLSVDPTAMMFTGTVDEVTEPQRANVTGSELTEDITVSTTAPFEISTDGVAYSTTATIPVTGAATNAVLYVRYSPTEEGSHSGLVLFASGTAADTIVLNGTAETEVPDTTIGISENTAHAIVIYPNPASTILNVEAEGYDQLQIVNVVGQVVYSSAIIGRTQVNVSGLSNGVYFVRLTSPNGKGTATQKFVKR